MDIGTVEASLPVRISVVRQVVAYFSQGGFLDEVPVDCLLSLV